MRREAWGRGAKSIQRGLTLRVILVEGAAPPRSRLDPADIRRVARQVAVQHGLRRGQLNVVLTDDEGLRRLNRAYRKIDAPTDVLSFDLRDRPGEDGIGEVYISLPYARRRASRRRRSLQKEVLHLTVHGILHIAGYGHETDEDWRGMERETRRYISDAP